MSNVATCGKAVDLLRVCEISPLVNDHIAIAGISPFLIGNTSTTQSGAPIFQPAMLDYRSVDAPFEDVLSWPNGS